MRFAIAMVAATLALQAQGLKPRPSAADYTAFAAQNGVQVAADPLDPEHAKKSFATDVGSSYIVMEIAVYPGNVPVKLSYSDFEIRLNGYATPVRAVSPEAIASHLSRPEKHSSSAPGGITVYPSANIGYESGGYDPYGRRNSGVVVGGGVGVGVGSGGRDVPPAVSDKNRSTMERELTDKGLPQGAITAPVAGYVYFPIPSNRKKFTVAELDYLGDRTTVNVKFPAPRHK